MSVQVIEAVYENVALKRDIFKKLDEICKPSAVLCTNTSTINIDMVNLSVFFFSPRRLVWTVLWWGTSDAPMESPLLRTQSYQKLSV